MPAVVAIHLNRYDLEMQAIRKKIVVDERGNPQEVIISWAQFRELSEALGLDLDAKAKSDLRAVRSDLHKRNTAAFKPLSAL
jgi:PHD/YefM family antitoxin component YafN of YafNO toxin-antitoxin module